ncbi:hypothetical protein R6Z07M_002008 [Ovis aries]
MSLWETSSRKLVPRCGGGRAVVGAEGRSPQAEVGRPPLALEPACLAHKRQPGCGLPCGSCSVRGGGRQAPTPTSALEPLPPSSSHCGPAAAGAHSRRSRPQRRRRKRLWRRGGREEAGVSGSRKLSVQGLPRGRDHRKRMRAGLLQRKLSVLSSEFNDYLEALSGPDWVPEALTQQSWALVLPRACSASPSRFQLPKAQSQSPGDQFLVKEPPQCTEDRWEEGQGLRRPRLQTHALGEQVSAAAIYGALRAFSQRQAGGGRSRVSDRARGPSASVTAAQAPGSQPRVSAAADEVQPLLDRPLRCPIHANSPNVAALRALGDALVVSLATDQAVTQRLSPWPPPWTQSSGLTSLFGEQEAGCLGVTSRCLTVSWDLLPDFEDSKAAALQGAGTGRAQLIVAVEG